MSKTLALADGSPLTHGHASFEPRDLPVSRLPQSIGVELKIIAAKATKGDGGG